MKDLKLEDNLVKTAANTLVKKSWSIVNVMSISHWLVTETVASSNFPSMARLFLELMWQACKYRWASDWLFSLLNVTLNSKN